MTGFGIYNTMIQIYNNTGFDLEQEYNKRNLQKTYSGNPEHSVAVIFWNGNLPTAIHMSFQRNVKETTMLYMYFALTCN